MSEEETQETGAEPEAAAPQAQEQEAATEEQQAQPESQHVPLSALQQERQRRQELEERTKAMEDHMRLMQAQGSQQTAQQPREPEYDESDVLTYGDFKKLANKYQTSLEEVRMMQKHPDYQEVVTNYLPEVIKENPSLRDKLAQTQDYELAYYLAKKSDAYRNAHQKNERSKEAERIMENTQKSGSLASIGSSSPVQQAKRYKDMSHSEFKRLADRNAGLI